MNKEKPTQTRYDAEDAPVDMDDLAIEFFDDDDPDTTQPLDQSHTKAQIPEAPRRAVAKAVVTKSARSTPQAKAVATKTVAAKTVATKSAPAKIDPVKIVSAPQKAVATAVFSKRSTTKRPIAKAVMKAVPKKPPPPAPPPESKPDAQTGPDTQAQDTSAQIRPVAQVVARTLL